jgi:LysR family transcriptional regulator, nitrogen assimilation regulatory protein
MNLKQLEYFVSVAELGSFSKAATVLDIAQPALSRQVRALEVDLRETLLLRNGRGVVLTEAGQRLFDHSVALLAQVASVREDMGASRDQPLGHITIGLPPSVGRQLTLPLIDHFKRHLPQARLSIVEGMSAHLGEWISSGRVDLGLIYNPEAHAALTLQPLLQEPLCLVVPHTQGPRGPVALRELGAYPLIVPERHHVLRRLIEAQATLAGLQLNIAWEVSGVPSIIDLVSAGHGNAVLTASAVQASGRGGTLVVRPLVEPQLLSVLCLATPAHKRPTPLMRRASQLLQSLTQSLPQATAAQSLPG